MASEYISKSVRAIDGDTYNSVSSTVVTGTTNTEIAHSFRKIFSILIDNDSTTSGYDISVKFNSTDNDSRTIKAGESLTIDDLEITAIYLTNASGNTVSYRMFMVGVTA